MKPSTITADIIRDLLPAYFAGTASPDTMALVNQYLKDNPDFLETLDNRMNGRLEQVRETQRTELIALERTRRMIRGKSIFMGFAIFFTLFPFSFSVTDNQFRWLMGDEPMAQGIFLLLAACCWVGYFIARRRLKITDLL